jgi:hypothetical protein
MNAPAHLRSAGPVVGLDAIGELFGRSRLRRRPSAMSASGGRADLACQGLSGPFIAKSRLAHPEKMTRFLTDKRPSLNCG